MTWLWLGMGLGILTLGAELLVRGAVGLATAVRISPLVIGLTVVAFGTSAPELVVSIQSALIGKAGIALGNVVGSNIFNVLFILGLSAMIIPLRVNQQLIWLDVPLMIAASGIVWWLSADGALGRLEGAGLLTGLVAYTLWLTWQGRKEGDPQVIVEHTAELPQPKQTSWWSLARSVGCVLLGLGMLVGGSQLFLDGAVTLARQWGFSELIIGLTLVAAGTSLPEVATSVMAAIKGERDLAVGNVIGSNLFNLLGVLGTAALLAPQGVAVSAEVLAQDFPVMLIVAVACLPIFLTGHVIHRWEGAVFFTYYLLYTGWLVLSAQAWTMGLHRLTVVLWGLIPLTVVAIIYSLILESRQARIGSLQK